MSLRSRWRRWRRRRKWSRDWCSVCMRDLRVGEVWEVRSGHQKAEDGFGGTYLSQTFCPTHRPPEATRA